MFVFKINNVDYSDCIDANGGLKLKRTAFDDEETSGRTLDLTMHRAFLGNKRTLKLKCRPITQQRMKQLATALNAVMVSITYLDFELGNVTKTFYGTDLEAIALGTFNGVDWWKSADFELVEV